MKKSFIFLLILLFFTTTVKLDANTKDEADEGRISTITGRDYNASYFESDILEENNLPYGIKHQKVWSYTSSSMINSVDENGNITYYNYDVDGFQGITGIAERDKFYSQVVNVLEVPSSKNVEIMTWSNISSYGWTLTTVKNSIKDFEKRNPGWKVIAAINGDTFDISQNLYNLPGQTGGPAVTNGNFYKTTDKRIHGSSGGAIGFANDGSTNSLITGEYKVSDEFYIEILDQNDNILQSFKANTFNQTPSNNNSSIYYGTYNNEQKYVSQKMESLTNENVYVINSSEIALPNSDSDFYGRGVITSKVAEELSIGEFAIVTTDNDVINALDLGVRVRVQRYAEGDFAGIKNISGYFNRLFENGVFQKGYFDDARAPRTSIGVKADGTIVMMVVDGRQGGTVVDESKGYVGMHGCDACELASIMNYYGCVSAYNLDGGGSSTMVIRDGDDFRIMNSPSDGSERRDGNCLVIAVKEPSLEVTEKITESSISFDVKTINANNYDLNKLYFSINDNKKEVVSGKVDFSLLSSNTVYNVKLFYEDSNNDEFELLTTYSYTTLKKTPIFKNVIVTEDSEFFYLQLNMDDPDSSVKNPFFRLNSYPLIFDSAGKSTVRKTSVGNTITSIVLVITADLNNGNSLSFTYYDPDCPSLQVAGEVKNKVSTIIKNIFN